MGTEALRAPDVVASSVQLPIVMADAVVRLYEREIARAAPRQRAGLDGVNYRFVSTDGRCAKTWPPDPETRAGKRVALADALARRAEMRVPKKFAEGDAEIQRLM